MSSPSQYAQAFIPPFASRTPAPPPPPPQTSPPRRPRLLRAMTGAVVAAAASISLNLSPNPSELPPSHTEDPVLTTITSSTTSLAHQPRPRHTSRNRYQRPYPDRPPALRAETEAEMLIRLGVAVACGAIIGTERRAASANAGIRTLTLVSLGSAIFSLTSLHGLGGDPSRMGAAISTGIGFLGSGAINGDISGSQRQLVTAASIWIAAALGVAAASGLFSMALLGAIVTVWILRWRLLHRYARVFLLRRFDQFKATLYAWKRQQRSVGDAVEKETATGNVREEFESWNT